MTGAPTRRDDLARIGDALALAAEILADFTPGDVAAEPKGTEGPVTEADLRIDAALLDHLPREDEGWLSEESEDGPERLDRRRVWIVDPIDGTREFVRGRPEWCVSVALVEAGEPVAGGILNPSTREVVLGAPGLGVTLDGEPVGVAPREDLDGAVVLASRTEIRRGEWSRWEELGIEVRPMGSVAWKLALVAAGRADATWTLSPKSEWDVAAGAALVRAAGGVVFSPDQPELRFNRPDPSLDGLAACPPGLAGAIREALGGHRRRAG